MPEEFDNLLPGQIHRFGYRNESQRSDAMNEARWACHDLKESNPTLQFTWHSVEDEHGTAYIVKEAS